MKSFVAISALLLLLSISSTSHSACIEAVVPELPNPDIAVMGDILRAQGAVRQYIARQEKYLACVGDNFRHDAVVDKMHEVANSYNNMARRYKSRMESMNMVIDLALVI
jgi:hypothetical protein